jgi:hypothetical protein
MRDQYAAAPEGKQAYRAATADARSAYHAARYSERREEYAKKNRAYRAANKEAIAARKKERYWRKRDDILAKKREYQAANRDKLREKCRQYRAANPEADRARKLQTTFCLHPAQYDAMEEGQGGCAICGKPCKSGRRLAVDHDHANGFVRGLLCTLCNTGLGKFQDSPELLEKAAAYLRAGGTQAFDIVTFAQEMAP